MEGVWTFVYAAMFFLICSGLPRCTAQENTTVEPTIVTETTTTGYPTTEVPTTTITNTTNSTDSPSTTPSNVTDASTAVPGTTTSADVTMPVKTTQSPTTPVTQPSHGDGAKATTSFDAGSFIGGIVLCGGVMAIVFFACKFYQARKAERYHTL